MQLSDNFDLREFVSRAVYNRWGIKSRWFVRQEMVDLAEFYKSFFTEYYKKKYPGKVKTVLVVINNWHYGGSKQYSGYREDAYYLRNGLVEIKSGSQHRFFNGFDAEFIIVFNDGTRVEVDYKEIHEVIKKNEALFMEKGLTTVEDVSVATGWLHSDGRWTGLPYILVVRP
jgi:hypothetical protein